ncbi:hypothetical protein [Bacillus sp. JJ722]|uniref:hypothetical protein n=1 Tax=Bacillus sp. JJ722 TaxID=3122973 RepID=UPI002FFD9FCE
MKPDSLRPAITIDSQRRIYLSAESRKLIGLNSHGYRLIVGFDKANQRIIVAKPEIVRVPDVQSFKFDKKHYTHAKRMVRELGFTDAELPLKFEYVGRDYSEYPSGAYAFQRVGFDAPDK